MTMLIILGTILVSWTIFEGLYRLALHSEQIASLDLASILKDCAKAAKGSQRRAAQHKLNTYFQLELERCQRMSVDGLMVDEQMPLFYLNNACSLYLEQSQTLPASSRKIAQAQMEEAANLFDGLLHTKGSSFQMLQAIQSLKGRCILSSLQSICTFLEELQKSSYGEQKTLLLLAGGQL
ncbi:hypothetical protein IM774_07310 [Erysipelotrichaceae bacterium RD49]|nr:hypothetical protein [Erysipelotrichaceae bacterium RD49]